MLFLLEELGNVDKALRTLYASLCTFLYKVIAKLFQLFIDVSGIRLDFNVQAIFRRITVVLTIVMTFYIIFEFIKYVVQPDNMTDKEKGVGKIGYKVVVVVLLIAFVPKLFDLAWSLQHAIIKSEAISKIIIGNSGIDGSNIGNSFSAIMLNQFYYYDADYWGDTGDPGNEKCTKGNMPCKRVVAWNINKLVANGEIPNLGFGLGAAKTDPDGQSGEKIPLITFDGLMAVAVGVFIVYILALYTIDLATRIFQLAYLEIIAPIPIMSYLVPKKDSMFNKWVQQCIVTYLDVFIRLAIMYFVLLLAHIISKARIGPDGLINYGNAATDKRLLFVILIMGLLLFAQKAPKLLGELFPKMGVAGGNFGLKAGERVAPLAARAIGASYGGLRRLAGGAITRGMNAHRRNKMAFEETGKTAKERRQDAKAAKTALRSATKEYEEAKSKRNAAALKGTKNNAEYDKAQKEFEKKRDALTEKQSSFADAMSSKNKSVFGNAVAGGLGGALRGAKAGFGATKLEEIGKKANEGATADRKAITAREQWLDSGGYSEAGRIVSGIEKNMGITTAAQSTEREIKTFEAQAKREQTVMKRESEASSKIDGAKDAIVSRMKAQKDTVKITGDNGGTTKTYKYKDSDGIERPHTIDVGSEGKTTSQIIADRTAEVNATKASADAANAEVEKMRARKLASKTWEKEAELATQKSATETLRSEKAGKAVWNAAQEQELQSANSRVSLLLESRKNATSTAAWDAANGDRLKANQELVSQLSHTKANSWTREEEEKLQAAQKQLETLESEKAASWTTEDEATLSTMETDAKNKAQESNNAEADLVKFTTAVAEDVFTQILHKVSNNEEIGSEYHPSYVNKVKESLTYVHEAARDETTREAMKKVLPADIYHEFITGNISSYSSLDKIKGELDKDASARGRKITDIEGTKARMETSSQYAADKSNDSASNSGK